MITRRLALAGLFWVPSLSKADPVAGFFRLPVTITDGGKVLLPLTINGQGPFSFLVDTGADGSSILTTLAQSLHLPFAESRSRRGVGGEDIASVYRAKQVIFGGQLRQNDVALGGVSRLGPNEDGLVAAGIVTTLPSEIDFGRSEIRIYLHGLPDISRYRPVKSYIDRDSARASAKIYCSAVIDGIPLKLLVDTGASVDLLLFPSTVKAHGLWDKYPDASAARTLGITGAINVAREVIVPDFAIGDITVPHLPVKMMDPESHNDNEGVDGLLGARFLKLFSVAVLPTGMMLRLSDKRFKTP